MELIAASLSVFERLSVKPGILDFTAAIADPRR
jgi:hypothetical protein